MKKTLLLIPAMLFSVMLIGCGGDNVSEPDKMLPKPDKVERPKVEGADAGGGMAVAPDERP